MIENEIVVDRIYPFSATGASKKWPFGQHVSASGFAVPLVYTISCGIIPFHLRTGGAVRDQFSKHYEDLLEGSYDCVTGSF
jgi:hypothetical protein